MIEIGRLAIKTAGRDAGKHAVVVDILDANYVFIDGEVRRRKCNVNHLFLLDKKIDIKKNASHEGIEKEFKKLKLGVLITKPKPKMSRPTKKRKTPEQLRAQKEEKRRLRDLFKKKEEPKKKESAEATLEEKAGISEFEKKATPEEKKEEKQEKTKSKEEVKTAKPSPKRTKKKEQ